MPYERVTDQLTYRPYRPGDESGIIQLYAAVFDFEMSQALWRWFYLEPPGGPAAIAVVENGKGQIVGHYAVQPRSFWWVQSSCEAGVALGHMIHPSVRSVDVLLELASIAYDACRERDIDFLYAFPNAMGMPVHERLLGWTALPEIVEWEAAACMLPQTLGSAIEVWEDWPRQPVRLGPTLTEAQSTVAGRRSAEWLRWRFFARPAHLSEERYRLHVAATAGVVEGYAALKRYVRDGVVFAHMLDWQAAEPHVAEALFASLSRSLSDWAAQRFSCWAEGPGSLRPLLLRAGVEQSGRRSSRCIFQLRTTGDRMPPPAADAWCMTMADSDIY